MSHEDAVTTKNWMIFYVFIITIISVMLAVLQHNCADFNGDNVRAREMSEQHCLDMGFEPERCRQ